MRLGDFVLHPLFKVANCIKINADVSSASEVSRNSLTLTATDDFYFGFVAGTLQDHVAGSFMNREHTVTPDNELVCASECLRCLKPEMVKEALPFFPKRCPVE